MGNLNINERIEDLSVLTHSIVSSTDLARKSSQILKEISENENSKLIIRNNQPTAVLMHMSMYERLMEIQENYFLLLLASERIDNNNDKNDISLQSLIKREGFDEKELEDLEEEIEFE